MKSQHNWARRLLALTSLLLICAMLFASCNVEGSQPTEPSTPTEPPNHTNESKPTDNGSTDKETDVGNDQTEPHVHEWSDWSVATEPTCTVAGEESRTCSCGEVEKQAVEATGHTYTSVVTEPTCTEKGYTTYTCPCGDSYVDNYVSATGHDYKTVVTAPTCTDKGYTTYTCDCGASYVDNYVSATGHTFGEWETTKEATCTEKGEQKRECACGEVETKSVSATGHSYDTVVTKPTCTERGYTTYTCSCGNSYVDNYVSATGHRFDGWKTTKEPTCTEKGEQKRECICGEVESKAVSATGHSYDAVVTKPTCTERGYTTYTCSCGEFYVDNYVSATGHSFGEWETTKEATCTENGEQKRECACGATETQEIEAKGHTEVIDEAVAATCTKTGLTEGKHCSVCKTVLLAQTEVPMIAHTYDDKYDESCNVCGFIREAECAHVNTTVILGKAPTCTESGLTDGSKCTKCGEILVEQEVIKANGHTEIIDKAVAPTCTKTGLTEGKHCSGCNTVLIVQTVISATGHDFFDWSVVTSATCTSSGSEKRECKNCDHYETQAITALGHNEVNHSAKSSTCTEIGWDAYVTCSRCDYTTYQEKSAKGHTVVVDHAVAETFLQAGLTEGKHCSVCDVVLVAQATTISGSRYGYNDFDNLSNGEAMQKLYYDMYCVCEQFFDNTKDISSNHGKYIISTFNLSGYGVTDYEAMAVWKIFYLENPRYYWLSNTLTISGGILPLCIAEEYALVSYRAQCNAAIEKMLNDCDTIINANMSDLEKALAIHDFVIDRMNYAYESDGITPESDIWAHNMVGCAKYKLGVCESYAKTYLYLCLRNNTECIIVFGDAGEAHAWNMICLDGVWYGVDCTWSDTNTEAISRNYFGASRSYLSATHTAETPNVIGVEYLYALPTLSERSLELVDLYEKDEYLGVFENIDMAFEAMTNANGDYTIVLHDSAIEHQIYAYETPTVNSIAFVGKKYNLPNNSFALTNLICNHNLSVNSNITLENINLNSRYSNNTEIPACKIELQNFHLMTQGYSVVINPGISSIVGTELSEIIVQTEYVSEFYCSINVHKLSQPDGVGLPIQSVWLRNYSQIDIVDVIRLDISYFSSKYYDKETNIVELYAQRLDLNRFCVVNIDQILNKEQEPVTVNIEFGKIEDFAQLTIEKVNCSLKLNIRGYVEYILVDAYGNIVKRWANEASPFNLTVPIAQIGRPLDFEKITINFLSTATGGGFSIVDKTSMYQLSSTGEIIPKEKTIQNNLVIMDNCIMGYVEKADSIVIPDGVTSIADNVFTKCNWLKSITIPNSVISIGDNAFSKCTGLTSITIPDSVASIGASAFEGCTGITSITFGNSVASIGEHAFWGCTGLTNIYIPESITSIGSMAFNQCYSLTNIIIGANADVDIHNQAFYGCPIEFIKAPASAFSNQTFAYSAKLKTIIITGGSSIANYAFTYCAGLTNITIPNSVKSIGDYAFGGCMGLTSIEIPNSVTSIGKLAFDGCTGLTSITIPDSVTSIGNFAFRDCTGLTSITISNSITTINYASFEGCTKLTSITIPDSVTYIDYSAFGGCTGLTNIKFTGTKAQWKAISKDPSWHRDTCNYTVYCTDGTIPKE